MTLKNAKIPGREIITILSTVARPWREEPNIVSESVLCAISLVSKAQACDEGRQCSLVSGPLFECKSSSLYLTLAEFRL